MALASAGAIFLREPKRVKTLAQHFITDKRSMLAVAAAFKEKIILCPDGNWFDDLRVIEKFEKSPTGDSFMHKDTRSVIICACISCKGAVEEKIKKIGDSFKCT